MAESGIAINQVKNCIWIRLIHRIFLFLPRGGGAGRPKSHLKTSLANVLWQPWLEHIRRRKCISSPPPSGAKPAHSLSVSTKMKSFKMVYIIPDPDGKALNPPPLLPRSRAVFLHHLPSFIYSVFKPLWICLFLIFQTRRGNCIIIMETLLIE